MIKLRPYQEDAIAAVWRFFRENPHGVPLVVCPTGSGKSLLCAKLIEMVIKQRPTYKTLVVSHRKEILEQNALELQGILATEPIGIWSAGLGQKRMRRVTYANIQSIYRADIPETHLVIIDECHLLPPDSKSMYQKFISRIFDKNRSCRILGLTATPYRLDSGSLLDNDSLFTDIAYDISIRDLIDQGYLSNLISRISESAVDLSEVKRSGHDYNQTEAEAVFNPETEKHCDEIIAKAGDRKHWLLFCSGVKHAEHTAEVLTAKGIPTLAVHGELLNMERDRRINAFKSGEVKALTNCNILTTGFNHRAVDLLVLLRATKSTALFVQMVGRGMRTAPGKQNCLVLDFGNNIKTHGPIDLIKVKTKKGQKTEISRMPSKTCPMCGCVVFIKVSRCPSCDYAFPSASCILQPVASTAPIISEPETHNVVGWDAKIHKKEGKPDSLRLTYKLEGGGQVSDFLCFEHGGFAAQMARKKWAARAGNIIPPASTEEAFMRIRELAEPKTVSLVRDGKYHRILSMTLKAPEDEFDSVRELGINI